VDYYGTYPQNPGLMRGFKPSFPNAQYYVPPCTPLVALNPPLKLGYWELLSPALFGAAGALFLSLFSDSDHLLERCGGTLFKLALVSYAIVATVSVSFAVSHVVVHSEAPYDHLINPIAGALVTIILFFAANYLLLYRFFPSSFKGEVGDSFWAQLFTFIYLSITSLATANLGDIMPDNITARALIATEIAFNLFTLATAIQLLLVPKN